MKTSEPKKSTLYILMVISVTLAIVTFALLIKGNYFQIFKETFAQENYDYQSNACYVQRTSQFEMLPIRNADLVFVGDSITGRFEWSEYYTDYTVANRGIDSDITEGVYHRLDNIVSLSPKKIFLMIGINDIGRGIPSSSTMYHYENIVDELTTALPDCEIYLQSVLPVNHSTGISNETVQALNEEIRQLADQKGLTYLDIYSEVVTADNNFTYTVDGVHLTGEGYAVWTSVLDDVLGNVAD